MKEFVKPIIEVIELKEDIITTSETHHYGPDNPGDDNIDDW